jgi:hypothetical protein
MDALVPKSAKYAFGKMMARTTMTLMLCEEGQTANSV